MKNKVLSDHVKNRTGLEVTFRKNARKKNERKKEKERKKERIKKKKCDEFCFLDLCCMHDHSKNQVRKSYQSLEQKERRGRKLRKILKLLKMEEEDCYQDVIFFPRC